MRIGRSNGDRVNVHNRDSSSTRDHFRMTDVDFTAVRRAVMQTLEGFQRAGLSHWKQIAPMTAEENVTNGAPESVRAGADSDHARAAISSANAPSDSRGQSTSSSSQQAGSMPKVSHSTANPAASGSSFSVGTSACVAFQPLNLPRAQRVTRLGELAEQVKVCVRCRELAGTRTQTVFGVGNPEAKILFVGEAPGADEDKQGEPFVGRAGQLLNDIIKACRMKREDIYICNVLRCRPPGNRLPSPEEAANCREYLDGQIAVVNPDYIVCWGSTAAKNLLSSDAPIGKMRGTFFSYGRAKVLCTYHPSYLLRNPAAKKDVWDDMKFLFKDMGVDLTAKTS
jgi:uracil-DNA glycosylase